VSRGFGYFIGVFEIHGCVWGKDLDGGGVTATVLLGGRSGTSVCSSGLGHRQDIIAGKGAQPKRQNLPRGGKIKKGIKECTRLTISYAALGLLPSIPLPTGASSSKTHRAEIRLPAAASASASASTVEGEEIIPKVSYGRIIRDDAGNVIDIILDDDEDKEEEEEGGRGEALNPEKEYVPERVEAKTDVVRCKCFFLLYRLHVPSLPFNDEEKKEY
jgi:hypothetical protein